MRSKLPGKRDRSTKPVVADRSRGSQLDDQLQGAGHGSTDPDPDTVAPIAMSAKLWFASRSANGIAD
jgi:hypothetical protein